MTEHDRDPDRPRIRITDKRRVSTEPRGRSVEPDEAAPGDATVTSAGDDEAASTGARGTGASKGGAESAGEPDRASEYLEDLRRLKAEFENYRKRVGKEQTRALEMAAAPTMAKLLEVLDEFELALMAADRSPDFERFVRGVEMVYAKLTDVLRSEGLERIDAEGKPFDPSRHEALLQSEDGEGEPYVADVLRTGYTLKGRVLRPAGVKVARK
jgi:molecular chaperone GrpE